MAEIVIKEEKLNSLIRQRVFEAVQEMLFDPDRGLCLTDETVRRLKKSIKSRQAGRVIPFDEILKKHRL